MIETRIRDINVESIDLIPTPREIKERLPLGERARASVLEARAVLEAILDRRDRRFFVVVGPCSIHDIKAAHDYADRLAGLAQKVADVFFVVMRVYFTKPRTAVGWKGFINDPYMDDSFRIDEGLFRARELLIALAEKRMPVGTEALDSIVPQYLDDLITWHAIGARTTESQTHREMASGLSTPVGFKNATDGNVDVALNALKSVSQPHHFLGINQEGQCAVIHTRGNRYGHIVLRGGRKPNYDAASVAQCARELEAAGLPDNIVIDCSHGNSRKDPARQSAVLEDVVQQVVSGNRSIVGVMLESNLEAGSQALSPSKEGLRYGVSVTDPCIDWSTTERIILDACEKLRKIRLP